MIDIPNKKRRPVFIVGCSRSGTTLLQSILSQHEEFASFAETNVFNNVLEAEDLDFRRFGQRISKGHRMFRVARGRILNVFGLTAVFDWDVQASCRRRLESALGDVTIKGRELRGRRWSIRRTFGEVEALFEQAAGGMRWIEKSPQNLWCLHLLVRYFPAANFVHIIREGTANVASLVDAGRKYDIFRGRFGGRRGLEKAVQFYNAAAKISHKYKGQPRHVFVRYEDLAENPAEALAPVGTLLEISIEESMLSYRTEGIVYSKEVWKQSEPEIKKRASKFDKVFDRTEKEYVEEQVVDVERLFPRKVVGATE